ncbi:MAG TPA: FkbM family methyltransferase [Chthoniobacterales bacterium]|nr:FkbM family methyltransferase [Chthoniobacterales bacterium]
MKRFLKRHFNRFLPDGARRALRRRWKAQFHPPTDAEFLLERVDSVLRCKVGNRFSFLAPLACDEQLVRFTSGDGRAEFHATTCAAVQGGVLFDIGAHSGVISALFCAAAPHNRAFAFEPSPILVRALREIRDLNEFGERMRIEKIGIGDRQATAEMLVDPASGFVQTRRFEQTMWEQPQHIEVRLERIADAAARLGVVPDFIKLDVEGFEYEAIKGSLDFLACHKPTIFLELHLNYLEERKLPGRAVVGMLQGCGYSFYSYSGVRLHGPKLYNSPLAGINVVAR